MRVAETHWYAAPEKSSIIPAIWEFTPAHPFAEPHLFSVVDAREGDSVWQNLFPRNPCQQFRSIRGSELSGRSLELRGKRVRWSRIPIKCRVYHAVRGKSERHWGGGIDESELRFHVASGRGGGRWSWVDDVAFLSSRTRIARVSQLMLPAIPEHCLAQQPRRDSIAPLLHQ
jgi:hypothetical protein